MAAVATWPAVTAPVPLAPSVTEEPSADDDDLWEQARQDALSGMVEDAEAVSPPEQETWEEAEETDQEQTVEEPASPKMQPSPVEQELPTLPADTFLAAAPVGTILASFSALIVWSQTVAPGTGNAPDGIARDSACTDDPGGPPSAYAHAPTEPAKEQRLWATETGPLERTPPQLLRWSLLGSWGDDPDRASPISTPPPTWGRVVTNPDDPDGLSTLVTALRQGFSLVVLDGETNYAASARAAVLTELRQRVANVTIGSCS